MASRRKPHPLDAWARQAERERQKSLTFRKRSEAAKLGWARKKARAIAGPGAEQALGALGKRLGWSLSVSKIEKTERTFARYMYTLTGQEHDRQVAAAKMEAWIDARFKSMGKIRGSRFLFQAHTDDDRWISLSLAGSFRDSASQAATFLGTADGVGRRASDDIEAIDRLAVSIW